jgi:Raf kinase inhibitor-like YbhB/YbcL family protein
MNKKIIKRVLIAIPILIILAIIARVVFVNIDQNKEFDYHNSLEKSINLSSNDFKHNKAIPIEFTGLGEEISPSLHWDNLPPETKSLVITAADYDGPSPTIRLFTIDHWVLFNIDPKINHIDKAITLEELEKQGIDLGLNVYSEAKYIGPDPPMGTHKYYFRIYALSVPSLDLDKPTRNELMEEIKDNIIAYGELVGTYKK